MDKFTYGIAQAREEELLAQIEVAKAQLRSLQNEIKRYRQSLPPASDFMVAFPALRGKRKAKIKDAVESMLTSFGKLTTTDIIDKLAERGIVNARDETDRAYARATMQRFRKAEFVYQDNLGAWHLKPQSDEWTCFLCGANHAANENNHPAQATPNVS